MTPKPTVCREIEPDLVATATGEALPRAAERVGAHVSRCAPCRDELQRYQAIETLVGDLRSARVALPRLAPMRAALEARLAELRVRLLRYRVFPSPIGRLLIARSEEGVALVEYLDGRGLGASRLARVRGVEAVEDGAEIEALYRDVLDYLGGRRTRLGWPLDFRLAASDFHRAVLETTSRLPYGAVTSYAHIAREIGRPSAVRAVAQALRRNPLPIIVPCHRVIGTSGSLTGYAGSRITLKQRLLTVEGIPTLKLGRDVRVKRDATYLRPDGEPEYCLPTCGSLPSRTLAALTLFGSRESAEAAGLAPCTSCRPDLHPLAR